MPLADRTDLITLLRDIRGTQLTKEDAATDETCIYGDIKTTYAKFLADKASINGDLTNINLVGNDLALGVNSNVKIVGSDLNGDNTIGNVSDNINDVIDVSNNLDSILSSVNKIENLSANATSLTPEEQASVELVNNTFEFGIPRGRNGSDGINGLSPKIEFTYNEQTGFIEVEQTGWVQISNETSEDEEWN